MGHVPSGVWGTKGASSLSSTQHNSTIKVSNRGDLPWRERTASRWQSWPNCPSVTTWSWEPAAPKASSGFPFSSAENPVQGHSPLPGHSISGESGAGLASRVRTYLMDTAPGSTAMWTRPNFSNSKVQFGTTVEPSRANETGVECIYFYKATNYQITFHQINYESTNASC